MIYSSDIKEALIKALSGKDCPSGGVLFVIHNEIVNYLNSQGYSDIAKRLKPHPYKNTGAYASIDLTESESHNGREKQRKSVIYIEWKKQKDPTRPCTYKSKQGYIFKDITVKLHSPTDWDNPDLVTAVKATDELFDTLNKARDQEILNEQKIYDLVMNEFNCDSYQARELIKKAYDDYYKLY